MAHARCCRLAALVVNPPKVSFIFQIPSLSSIMNESPDPLELRNPMSAHVLRYTTPIVLSAFKYLTYERKSTGLRLGRWKIFFPFNFRIPFNYTPILNTKPGSQKQTQHTKIPLFQGLFHDASSNC